MKEHLRSFALSILPNKTTIILFIILLTAVSRMLGFKTESISYDDNKEKSPLVNEDSVESVNAFASVYTVLMSPRCMNCHPAGDVPLQGEDSHLHTMGVKRGTDGKGIYALKCSNCHQDANVPGLHTPPGNPKWHLPPKNMKMVFQGRTPKQLAKQLLDPKQNGGKNIQQLIEHVSDTLVLAGWHPGEGRTLPPMSHEAFSKAWVTWISKGAYAPN